MSKAPSIGENLEGIQSRIEAALAERSRDSESLTLIAVSKRQPLAVINNAYKVGIRHFGENQIQEGVPKVKTCPKDIQWHFIGHLQKNKVRKAVIHFPYIHSIDSLSLLQRVNVIAEEERLRPKLFLQVNYALDPDKYGFHPEAVKPVLEAASALKNVTCVGLMGIPPVHADAEGIDKYFADFAKMRDELKELFPQWPGLLSLGMSSDFEIAIRNGSNFIRVGSALLGERH